MCPRRPSFCREPVQPASEFTRALEHEPPGKALDIACGGGRHSAWLTARGWTVKAVDLVPTIIPGVEFTPVDLEVEPLRPAVESLDLIVCWLYWQPNLLEGIADGVRQGGVVALAGKTSGRFATSLKNYRAAFPGWPELSVGEADDRAHFIARKP